MRKVGTLLKRVLPLEFKLLLKRIFPLQALLLLSKILYGPSYMLPEREMKILPILLNNASSALGVAVDIGAHLGLYSYWLSPLCKKVYAFDPQPLSDPIREKIMNLKNVEFHGIGLGDVEGEMTLNIPFEGKVLGTTLATLNQTDKPSKKLTVAVNTLDSYNLEDVVLIKIDVEGFEDKVLDGARNTIMKYKPNLLIEIEDRHLVGAGQKPQDIIRKLIAWGYSCYYYHNDDFTEVDVDTISIDRLQGEEAMLSGSYINNFIFLDSEVPLPF